MEHSISVSSCSSVTVPAGPSQNEAASPSRARSHSAGSVPMSSSSGANPGSWRNALLAVRSLSFERQPLSTRSMNESRRTVHRWAIQAHRAPAGQRVAFVLAVGVAIGLGLDL